MDQCCYYVIADDLTGANATGVLLKKEGLLACTVLGAAYEAWENIEKYNVIIRSTGSRNLHEDEAYELVKKQMKIVENRTFMLVTKRIDSTMRGNIGRELDAIADSLEPEYIIIAAPAFPEAGRTVKEGKLYVHGILLELTGAAADPGMPVKLSDVKEIVESQSRHPVALIKIADVHGGQRKLLEAIENRKRAGAKIIVFDSETNEDLQLIAEALVKGGIKFAAADPGPFTQIVARVQMAERERSAVSGQVAAGDRAAESGRAAARAQIVAGGRAVEIGQAASGEQNKILLVVGSVSPVTAEQMSYLWQEYGADTTVMVSTKDLVESRAAREKEIRRVTNACHEIYKCGNFAAVVGDGIFPDKRIAFSEDSSNHLNHAFAKIVETLYSREERLLKLYISGGDITLAVFDKMEATGFVPLKEVVSLAVYGTVKGGRMEGCEVVTKGGMAGKKDAIFLCVKCLEKGV